MNQKPRISIIAAVSQNLVIGNHGTLPWHIKPDLQRFKSLTTGHPIIMGRKTYQSIGHALPNRTNIIISRQNLTVPDAIVTNSLNSAIDLAARIDTQEVFVIGGAQIYLLALLVADRLYLTKIHQDYEGDTYFPQFDKVFNITISVENFPAHSPPFSFVTLDKDLARVNTL